MFTLADVAVAAGHPLSPTADSLVMSAAHFDSRRINPDMLFVALPGAHVDGHNYIADAFRRGASAVLCARPDPEHPLGLQIVARNPQLAFERLARTLRSRCHATVIGITGSNGKTTTKEALAATLRTVGSTLATDRSENAEVGVPATLSKLAPSHRYAVVEIGAQVSGEISRYCAYTRPDAAIITSIAGAHLGLFGSIEAIAAAKAELLDALPVDGPAVLNADDPWTNKLRRRIRGPITTFGRSDGADVHLHKVFQTNPPGTRVHINAGSFSTTIDAPGTAGAVDLAFGAAFALARSLGISPEDACRGLAHFHAPSHRMRLTPRPGGGLLLDDTYNANVSSMTVALAALRDAKVPGRRIAVLGDMFELGEYGPSEHEAVGHKTAFLDRLLCVGSLAQHVAAGARAAGLKEVDLISADTRCEASITSAVMAAGNWIESEVRHGDAVLLKASNGMRFAQLTAKASCNPET